MMTVARVLVFGTVFASVCHAQQSGKWYWFAACGGPAMTLEVQLHGQLLFRSTFPICMAEPGGAAEQGTLGRQEFYFHPERNIEWKGGGDDNIVSELNSSVEGNIWLAGSESYALLIGIAFSDGQRILMNTIHIAKPDTRSETRITDELTVSTFPAEAK